MYLVESIGCVAADNLIGFFGAKVRFSGTGGFSIGYTSTRAGVDRANTDNTCFLGAGSNGGTGAGGFSEFIARDIGAERGTGMGILVSKSSDFESG